MNINGCSLKKYMEEIKKKILVLEDEEDILKVICMRLTAAGYDVISAGNGQEGVERVFRDCPDLIISDVVMPVMDGFTFYKKLKENPATVDIPVLILTARGQMEDSFRVMGVDEFLRKPFEPVQLLGKVEALLSRASFKVVHHDKKVVLGGADRNILETMVFQLKKAGCEVELAKDGAEIITKVVQFAPDVLILEVPLYGMTGDEVIKILRQMAQFKNRPILIFNFFSTEDLGSTTVRQKAMLIDDAKTAAMEAGATANLGRFNEFTFIESITKYLEIPSTP
ncbi:MAG: response regulator [Candidatus Aceula meridiana]|nr:response regulator [Candidatus Aceula meridiana]